MKETLFPNFALYGHHFSITRFDILIFYNSFDKSLAKINVNKNSKKKEIAYSTAGK